VTAKPPITAVGIGETADPKPDRPGVLSANPVFVHNGPPLWTSAVYFSKSPHRQREERVGQADDSFLRALVGGSVFFDVVDDHHFERGRLRFQFEAELPGKRPDVCALQVDPAGTVEDLYAGVRVEDVG